MRHQQNFWCEMKKNLWGTVERRFFGKKTWAIKLRRVSKLSFFSCKLLIPGLEPFYPDFISIPKGTNMVQNILFWECVKFYSSVCLRFLDSMIAQQWPISCFVLDNSDESQTLRHQKQVKMSKTSSHRQQMNKPDQLYYKNRPLVV